MWSAWRSMAASSFCIALSFVIDAREKAELSLVVKSPMSVRDTAQRIQRTISEMLQLLVCVHGASQVPIPLYEYAHCSMHGTEIV